MGTFFLGHPVYLEIDSHERWSPKGQCLHGLDVISIVTIDPGQVGVSDLFYNECLV